ncbi:MAG: glycosyl hydrolase, partial [Saprospiraceae bacterium]|nr:glycosyl hydrolase [Saprospiraceae bacterium]
YQIRVSMGDEVITKSLNVVMNPNLKGITKEDLNEQFELASKIRDKTSTTNEAVIHIRKMRSAINATKNEEIIKSASPFVKGITAIEEELYQVKNQSNQDPLNFPIKLNNRFASLRRSMENGDAKPTDGAYKVFKELSLDLDNHLAELKALKQSHLVSINQMMSKNGFDELKTFD